MVVSSSLEPVDAGSDQEIRPRLTGKAEEFIDVALAVADMDASLRRANELRRKAKIVQPAHAFLLLDRHPRRIDLARQRLRALELFPGPEFRRGQPERQALHLHSNMQDRQNSIRPTQDAKRSNRSILASGTKSFYELVERK